MARIEGNNRSNYKRSSDGKLERHSKKTVYFSVAAVLLTLIVLLASQASNDYHQSQEPYSVPIENTDLFVYTCNAELSNSNTDITNPEKAATALAKLFLNELMIPSDIRTFTITAYKDLRVHLLPTLEMDSESADIYMLQASEISKDTWVVEIDVTFQYKGVISPIGSAEHQWVSGLYQGSPVGFLLTRNGLEYTMRSRYNDAQ